MTKREAMQIIIRHAARDAAGTGCGIRSGITKDEKSTLVAAFRKVWPQVYGFDLGDNELFNLGLMG